MENKKHSPYSSQPTAYTKKMLVLIMALALFIQPLPTEVSAAAASDMSNKNEISIMSENTAYISTTFSIDPDGVTNCTGTVLGKSGTTRIAGTMKIMKGTTTVKSWTVSTNSDYLHVSKTCYLLSRGTYKLILSVHVTRNNFSEPMTCSSLKVF